jgi:hypothetical protein
VGGLWSIAVQMVVPQHAACDLSSLTDVIQSRLGISTQAVDAYSAVLAQPSTCSFLGVHDFHFMSATMDFGFDGCAAPWSSVFPHIRGMMVLVMWVGFVIMAARAFTRAARGGDGSAASGGEDVD